MKQKKPSPPSVFFIAVNDPVCAGAGVVGFGMLIVLVPLLLLVPAEGRDETFNGMILVMIGLAVIAGIVLAMKLPTQVRHLRDVWERSVLLQADVVKVKTVLTGNKPIQELTYRYKYEDKTYTSTVTTSRHWKPSGETVLILADPKYPGSSLLTDLYRF